MLTHSTADIHIVYIYIQREETGEKMKHEKRGQEKTQRKEEKRRARMSGGKERTKESCRGEERRYKKEHTFMYSRSVCDNV